MLDTLAKTEPFGYAQTGQPETAKELLDRAGRWLQQDVSQRPELRARLLEAIGRTYRRRGDDREAIGFYRQALGLREQLSGSAGDLATAGVMTELSVATRGIGDLAGADRLLREAATMLQGLGEERSLAYSRVLTNRARLEMSLGRPDVAKRIFDESLALARELTGSRDIAVAEVLADQAYALNWLEDMPAAEQTARQAVDIYSALPELHPDRVYAEVVLGEILWQRGKLAEASSIFNQALQVSRKIFGENDRRTADALDSLAKIALAQNRLAEAAEFARQALERGIKGAGVESFRTGYSRTTLAMIQIQRGEYADAEVQSRAALAVFEKTLPPDHPYVASAEYQLGMALLATERPKDAEACFRAAMNRAKRAGEPEWRVARAASGLGDALYRQGRAREAEPYLVDSYRTISTSKNADVSTQEVVRDRVVRFYTERRQPDRLQALMATTQRP